MSREMTAKAVVERHLGVLVRCHDDQSEAGMHDLEFDLPSGGLGAVEVTAAEDQTWAADVGALSKDPVQAGESVKTIQCRMGHASAMVTLDVYGHLWPDSEERTRAAVDARLGAPADSLRTAEA